MTEHPEEKETGVPSEDGPAGQEPQAPNWLTLEPSGSVASEAPGPDAPAPSGAGPEPPSEPPVKRPVPESPRESPPAPPRRISRRAIWTIAWIVLGLLIVCIVAVVLVARPYVTGAKAAPLPPFLAGDRMLVAFPSLGGDDLYLLRMGDAKNDGLLLAEDVAEASISVYAAPSGQPAKAIGSSYGGFVPGKDWLLVWYAAEDVSTLGQMNSRAQELTTVLDSKGDWLYGYVFPGRDTLFLVESRDERSRCYVARPNGEAVRVARADDCTVSLDGSTVFLHDVYSDETLLSAVGIRGGKETILLDDVVGVESYRVAPDGSQVAYVVADEGFQQLVAVERSGEQAPVSDKLNEILAYGYAPGGGADLFYVARERAEDSAVQLYLSTGERPIDQGATIEASFTPDGKYVVALVAGDQGSTLNVHPLGDGETKVVLSQEGIAGFAILETTPPKLLVPAVEDGAAALYAADLDGTNVTKVLTAEVSLERVHYVPGERALYVQGQAADGAHALYVVPLDGTGPLQVLAGWAELDLLNRSSRGAQLAFQGRQASGDPLLLYAVPVKEGAAPVELDGGYQRYERAVFAGNGRSILYTARVGDARDAVDVVLVDANGEKKPQLLYEKAYLVDVRWDQLDPFVTLFQSDR